MSILGWVRRTLHLSQTPSGVHDRVAHSIASAEESATRMDVHVQERQRSATAVVFEQERIRRSFNVLEQAYLGKRREDHS